MLTFFGPLIEVMAKNAHKGDREKQPENTLKVPDNIWKHPVNTPPPREKITKIIRPEYFYVFLGAATAKLRNCQEINPPRIIWCY